MKPRIVRYSLAFKKKVLSELESGRFVCASQASQYYGISKGTISNWIRKFGRTELAAEIVRVQVGDETATTKDYKKRIKKLEKLVSDMALENHYKEALLTVIAQENNCSVDELSKKKDIRV